MLLGSGPGLDSAKLIEEVAVEQAVVVLAKALMDSVKPFLGG